MSSASFPAIYIDELNSMFSLFREELRDYTLDFGMPVTLLRGGQAIEGLLSWHYELACKGSEASPCQSERGLD